MRLLTWNVHGFRDASVATIADEISAHRADVVCLNEVPRAQGRRIGGALGMRAFVASSPLGPYGNTILTSQPVDRWRRLRFSGVRRTARRDAAIVGLAGGLTVAAVHLSLRAAERARHIAELLAALPPEAIVAGDMNERPGGTVWNTLDARLADAAAAVAAAVTAPQPTFPAGAPTARIDGIWVPYGTQVIRCEVTETTASDHRPVFADVDLT